MFKQPKNNRLIFPKLKMNTTSGLVQYINVKTNNNNYL